MKRLIKALLLLLFTLNTGNLYARRLQGQPLIDSLLLELPKQKEDTNKVTILDVLAFEYRNINPDEGIRYGRQVLGLATSLDWKKGIANANNDLGVNYANKQDHAKAMEYYNKALEINKTIGNKRGIAMIAGNIANVYADQNNNPKALEYYLMAEKVNEEIGNKNALANNYNGIAGIYQSEGNYHRAIEYYQKALAIATESGNKNIMMAVNCNLGIVCRQQSDYPKALEYYFTALSTGNELGNKNAIGRITGNIGSIYKDQHDLPKALQYYQESLKLAEEIDDKDGIARQNNLIGQIYKNQSDYSRALGYYFKALKINEETGSKKNAATIYGDIGNAYNLQKNQTEAVAYFQRALKINREIGNKHGIAIDLSGIGNCFISIVKDTSAKNANFTAISEISIKKYTPTAAIPNGKKALLASAIDHFNKSLAIFKELHAMSDLADVNGVLSEAYKLSGDYKKALEYADSLKSINDSVFSIKNRQKIEKLEDARKQYGDSIKIAEAKKMTDVKAAHRRNYELIGIGVLVLALCFIFLLKKNNKLLDKEKKQSDNLLLNILPEEVAAQLKDTGKSAAKQFDNVTVMFTDFVNFTEASERMTPEALIEELDICFKAFDDITSSYNVEKIKTIGDAYLAVCGLPTPDPKHAENIINAAKDITEFMADRLSKLGSERTFAVRIGIHSGSVVAGIVGVKKFAYDIWGDTVNTAARMEQNSEAGKINISQTTYELVKDKFSCEYRGEVEAKGKGVMRMYFVQ